MDFFFHILCQIKETKSKSNPVNKWTTWALRCCWWMWQCLSPPAFDAPLTDWLCLQNVWCGRTEIREEEVDSLFWGCDGHYLHRGHEWIRLNAGGRPGNGEMTRRKEKNFQLKKKNKKLVNSIGCVNHHALLYRNLLWAEFINIQMTYKKKNNMGIKHGQSTAMFLKSSLSLQGRKTWLNCFSYCLIKKQKHPYYTIEYCVCIM